MTPNTPFAKATSSTSYRLLFIGPQVGPIGGAVATAQVFLDEFAKRPEIKVDLINSSPPPDFYAYKKHLINTETVSRTLRVLNGYTRKIRSCDTVLVLANNHFTFNVVPWLLILAKIFHKPFYLKPIGGDLDLALLGEPPLTRRLLLQMLRSTDGILAQTRLLQTLLQDWGCQNTHYISGVRARPQVTIRQGGTSPAGRLRLLFFSQVKREKGIFILLEALRALPGMTRAEVSCDFYGPVFEQDREEFFKQIAVTPGVSYCGKVKIGTGSQIMSQYDALVLPTSYNSEGHPGVLIEAMQVGLPIISTQHRAIPELVINGENGLLTPVEDVAALANAIIQLAEDDQMRRRMGAAGYRRGQEFWADVVIPRALEIIFPQLATATAPDHQVAPTL